MDTQHYHRANRNRWNASADRWAACADSRGIWQRCHEDASLVFPPRILEILGDVSEQRICVLGSGDQQAVFALAGMGAHVTSVDISEQQLKHGAQRAAQLGLAITFVQQDVTQLDRLAEASFDWVYTGGHVAVWVADLRRYYAEAVRILRPGGQFLVEEYHPFRRIWAADKTERRIGYDYYHRGPYEYHQTADILYPNAGTYVSYEFHWTVADYINAVLRAGCQLQEVYEYGDQAEGWEAAPVGGLPHWLCILGRKYAP